MNLSTIETKLEAVCSDNPLDLRISKQSFRANIRLKDPNIKIKVAPMQYTKDDREEFSKQIKELLDAKLIQPSKSPHFSPAFLVNKHSEQKRGKRRMVINYKKLNDNTIGDGYLLPRKDELLDQVRGKKLFYISLLHSHALIASAIIKRDFSISSNCFLKAAIIVAADVSI
jgi:hypothetical protein